MRFEVTIRNGQQYIAGFEGVREIKPTELSGDDFRDIIRTEQFLEKLTGFRWHINQMGEDQ